MYMQKKNMFKRILFKTILPTLAITFSVSASFIPTGCSNPSDVVKAITTEEPITFVENTVLPVLLDFSLSSSNNLVLYFNKNVTLENSILSEKASDTKLNVSADSYNSTENSVTYDFESICKTGIEYILDTVATDESGNTLTLSLPFTGYNTNMAGLLLSEIRIGYASVKSGETTVHKSEFAELICTKDGNLSGIELVCASSGEDRKFKFPAIDVQKGDYITVHLRTPTYKDEVEEGIFSETNEDKCISTHIDSCDTAIDLWAESTKSVFNATGDVVIVRNSYTNEALDGFIYTQDGMLEDSYTPYASVLVESKIWNGPYFDSNGITKSAAARSMSRQNISGLLDETNAEAEDDAADSNETIYADSKDEWIKTKEVTPGYLNSSKTIN